MESSEYLRSQSVNRRDLHPRSARNRDPSRWWCRSRRGRDALARPIRTFMGPEGGAAAARQRPHPRFAAEVYQTTADGERHKLDVVGACRSGDGRIRMPGFCLGFLASASVCPRPDPRPRPRRRCFQLPRPERRCGRSQLNLFCFAERVDAGCVQQRAAGEAVEPKKAAQVAGSKPMERARPLLVQPLPNNEPRPLCRFLLPSRDTAAYLSTYR
jgi:hypothetical protein